jgi:hypothetical protein
MICSECVKRVTNIEMQANAASNPAVRTVLGWNQCTSTLGLYWVKLGKVASLVPRRRDCFEGRDIWLLMEEFSDNELSLWLKEQSMSL